MAKSRNNLLGVGGQRKKLSRADRHGTAQGRTAARRTADDQKQQLLKKMRERAQGADGAEGAGNAEGVSTTERTATAGPAGDPAATGTGTGTAIATGDAADITVGVDPTGVTDATESESGRK